MRRLFSLLLPLCALVAAPAHARETVVYEVVEEWVEVPAAGAERFVATRGEALEAGAAYGPFRVLDGNRAALVGITDGRSPAQFAAMLRDHPQLATLELLECPGTFDDLANLQLGRMIRQAGLVTHVPAGGSVRSGAVELFLAGSARRIDDGAEFAVHAWEDEEGLEATDFAADAPENRKYLAYYREMGMDESQAAAFYAMTNSVPFERARWLDAAEMRRWLPDAQADTQLVAEPVLAYLDLEPALN
jgi:hypothetical protein